MESPSRSTPNRREWSALARDIRAWGRAEGFDEIGIAGIDLADDEARLLAWLAAGRHGTMDYMARHGARRARPAELVPGTVTGDHGADELPAAAGARERGRARRSGEGVRRALRARPRLPQGAAREAAAPRRPDRRRRSARSAIACSPTARRCSKSRSPRARGSAGAASTRCSSRATPARGSSWASSTPTSRCPRRRRVAALRHVHARASTSARRARSSRRTSSTRAAASRISRSSTPAAFPRRCARSWATGSTAATTASSSARGTATRRSRRSRHSPSATGSTTPTS